MTRKPPTARDIDALLKRDAANVRAALDTPAPLGDASPLAYLRPLAGAAALAAAAVIAWAVLWQPAEITAPQPGFDPVTQAQWTALRTELRDARDETKSSLNGIVQMPKLSVAQEPLTTTSGNLASLGQSQMDALATELTAPVAQFIEQAPELRTLLHYAARKHDAARG